MSVVAAVADRHVETSRRLLSDLLRWYGPRDFTVRFWNGDEWLPDDGRPSKFTWVLNHPGALRAAYVPPTAAQFGSAYLYDDFDVEGDMVEFVRMSNYLHHTAKGRLRWLDHLGLGWKVMKLPNTPRPRAGHTAAKVSGEMHSVDRDRQAISYHYDFSNKCFEWMLGPATMCYASGVFERDDEDLDTAQFRKLDMLCRKLRLQPGQRMLDVGSGWGGLVMHAAKHFGVEAVGVTISKEQAACSRERIARAGLEDRCRIDLIDYRHIDPSEQFDKIVTVEVMEHFGAAMFPTFFRKCRQLLKPRGNMLIQQITLSGKEDTTAAPDFSRNFVFPDGELTPVSTTLRAAEGEGFEVRDVEGFREHYILTLRHWLKNTEDHHDDIVATTSEAGYRMFRIYFAAACYGFLANVYNLHQVLLSNPDDQCQSGMPMNRTDWYQAK
jgi:cyclopropane-fatty-acyl-phospholipid synthase